MNDQVVLACNGIAKAFNDAGLEVSVLRDINLNVNAGERIAIIGASGTGKSTLLHILGGLDMPTAGDVFVAGNNMTRLSNNQRGLLRNSSLGFVYQFHHLLPEFTALENVCMPLLIRGDSVSNAQALAQDMLQKVGLDHRLKHKPGELSGGERQRAALARALVTRPACILADEPTGNLDHETADKVYDLMMDLNLDYNLSFVVVTHDMQLAARMDKIFRIEDGILIDITNS